MRCGKERRRVFYCFDERGTEVASIDHLTEYLARHGHGPGKLENIPLEPHHRILPRLAATGFLDYDTRNRTVRYHGDSRMAIAYARELEGVAALASAYCGAAPTVTRRDQGL